ncbi:MAG: DNA translocase FtsK 4TM domain-containing protein [Candidatus Saccharimonadales bacterium]|nr:DNA translocase FtsK 4TM domain-containing protein [Candidatus Saccharimonadales bacterium]
MSKRKQKKAAKASAKAAKEKKSADEHKAPEQFWKQAVAAIFGFVFAPLMILAIFNIGGALPDGLLSAARWLFGIVGFVLPIVMFFMAMRFFRTEEGKLPRSFVLGIFLLLATLAGFFHLLFAGEEAENGDGGGVIGGLIEGTLGTVLDGIAAALVLIALVTLSLLYVLQIPIKNLLFGILRLFGKAPPPPKEETKEDETKDEFKLNEGVPVQKRRGIGFKAAKKVTDDAEPEALTASSDPGWEFPSLDLLNKKQYQADAGDIKGNAAIIKDTLENFNISVDMEGANVGPRVTQYTLKPHEGVRLTKITSLEGNLSLNLAAQSIRIEAPIPGKRAVGIEVPNNKAATVTLHSIFTSKAWTRSKGPLWYALGKGISGDPKVSDLDIMPHLLIAGATGSGKSVMINTFLASLLYRNTPSDLKLILIDPKKVELTLFDEMPHLLTPVISEPEKCISALKWTVAEMDRRYDHLKDAKKRNIAEYNRAKKNEKMPYIVVVIDELQDFMQVAARDMEALVARLAAKSRAVGIHLVVATQRPSVDVITGTIKANIPARIAFTVTSQVDSRTIIDQAGAEKLLGTGDMLMTTPQNPKPVRIQGVFISNDEVQAITEHVRIQRAPEYDDEVISQPVQIGGSGTISIGSGPSDDSLYKDAVDTVIASGKASASLLQRRLRVGYARAARLIESMEEAGIIGPADGARPREVLVSSLDEVFGGDGEEDDSDI